MSKKVLFVVGALLVFAAGGVATVVVWMTIGRGSEEESTEKEEHMVDRNTQREDMSQDNEESDNHTDRGDEKDEEETTSEAQSQPQESNTNTERLEEIEIPEEAACIEPLGYEGKKTYDGLEGEYYQFRGNASTLGIMTYLLPVNMLSEDEIAYQLLSHKYDDKKEMAVFYMDAFAIETKKVQMDRGMVFIVTNLNKLGVLVEYDGTMDMGDDEEYDAFRYTNMDYSYAVVFLIEKSSMNNFSDGTYKLSGTVKPDEGGAAAGTSYYYTNDYEVEKCPND